MSGRLGRVGVGEERDEPEAWDEHAAADAQGGQLPGGDGAGDGSLVDTEDEGRLTDGDGGAVGGEEFVEVRDRSHALHTPGTGGWACVLPRRSPVNGTRNGTRAGHGNGGTPWNCWDSAVSFCAQGGS